MALSGRGSSTYPAGGCWRMRLHRGAAVARTPPRLFSAAGDVCDEAYGSCHVLSRSVTHELYRIVLLYAVVQIRLYSGTVVSIDAYIASTTRRAQVVLSPRWCLCKRDTVEMLAACPQ